MRKTMNEPKDLQYFIIFGCDYVSHQMQYLIFKYFTY